MESLEINTNLAPYQPPKTRPGSIQRPSQGLSKCVPLNLGPREVLLDHGELRALLTEIASFADVREASLKQSLKSPPSPAESLPKLFVALSSRRIFGAQILYELRGQLRMDTLLVKSEGTICVRDASPL